MSHQIGDRRLVDINGTTAIVRIIKIYEKAVCSVIVDKLFRQGESQKKFLALQEGTITSMAYYELENHELLDPEMYSILYGHEKLQK